MTNDVVVRRVLKTDEFVDDPQGDVGSLVRRESHHLPDDGVDSSGKIPCGFEDPVCGIRRSSIELVGINIVDNIEYVFYGFLKNMEAPATNMVTAIRSQMSSAVPEGNRLFPKQAVSISPNTKELIIRIDPKIRLNLGLLMIQFMTMKKIADRRTSPMAPP